MCPLTGQHKDTGELWGQWCLDRIYYCSTYGLVTLVRVQFIILDVFSCLVGGWTSAGDPPPLPTWCWGGGVCVVDGWLKQPHWDRLHTCGESVIKAQDKPVVHTRTHTHTHTHKTELCHVCGHLLALFVICCCWGSSFIQYVAVAVVVVCYT